MDFSVFRYTFTTGLIKIGLPSRHHVRQMLNGLRVTPFLPTNML
jgi:hypothetical protein